MGVIRITVEHSVRISATGARVHVTMTAQSSLAATAAVKKVAEVRSLIEALGAAGIPEGAIDVTDVRIVTGSGKLLTSQQVTITLEVAAGLDQVPQVLSLVVGRPGSTVDSVEWTYDEFEASIPVAQEAMRRARRKADAVAQAAGMRVVGVESASDSWSMPTPRQAPVAYAAEARMMVGGGAPVADLGLSMSSTTELNVRLTADFDVVAADA